MPPTTLPQCAYCDFLFALQDPHALQNKQVVFEVSAGAVSRACVGKDIVNVPAQAAAQHAVVLPPKARPVAYGCPDVR